MTTPAEQDGGQQPQGTVTGSGMPAGHGPNGQAPDAGQPEPRRLLLPGDPVDPESFLVRKKDGQIDLHLTAEYMLPRSDQMSGAALSFLGGGLFHYGTQYKEWLAWDDDSHVHSPDARDEVSRLVQGYANAHRDALRAVREQVKQTADLAAMKWEKLAKEAEDRAAKVMEGSDVKATAVAMEAASLARKVALDVRLNAMDPYYSLFKKHRAYRDKLWGKRTKADVAGELKTFLATDMGDFDASPAWLVCDSGVIVVETSPRVRFPLLAHDPSRLVTKRLGRGVIYDPYAQWPGWEKFLESTVREPADGVFLKRRVGAALAGIWIKDFINIIGAGDSGKTTFNMVMKALFGSYFASPDVSVFMTSGDPMPWDLDLCRGARYVYAAEPEAGSMFRDGLVKRLTGGDPVESARKYGHPVTWDPQCLLVFNTNHPIFFDTSDTALFGRSKPVEFCYSGKPDPGLRGALLAELPGILNWALEGLYEYLTDGVPAVTPSMAALRERMAAKSDPVLRFLEEAINGGYLAHDASRAAGVSEAVEVRALYPRFTSWCGTEGIRSVTGKQKFNERIARIYPVGKSLGFRRFTGLLPGPGFEDAFWAIDG